MAEGLYVYGFMRADDAPSRSGGGVGEPAGEVVAIVHDGLAALATPVAEARVAPRRENLLAHKGVLDAALAHGPVVPLRFGTVMPGERGLRDELAARADRLTELLAALDGRVEMSVSATYRQETVLREVLEESPAADAVRRRIAGRSPDATHFDRIRLGELIAQAVEAKRAADGGAIARELEPLAVAVAPGRALSEWTVLNGAFLVERERLEDFDAAVERVSRARAERMRFKLLGPLPAHSFVGAG